MIGNSEAFYQSLGIPYQVVNIVSTARAERRSPGEEVRSRGVVSFLEDMARAPAPTAPTFSPAALRPAVAPRRRAPRRRNSLSPSQLHPHCCA